MKEKYKIIIYYNKESIKELFKVNHYSYNKKFVMYCIVVGLLFVTLSLFISMPNVVKAIMLMISAISFTLKDFPYYYKMQEMLEGRNIEILHMEYNFYENYIEVVGDNGGKLEYKQIKKLIDKGHNLFLLIRKDVLILLSKKEISDIETFKKFIEAKTDLLWKTDKNILFFNIYDIKEIFKNKDKRIRQ